MKRIIMTVHGRSQGQFFTEANIVITSLVRYVFNEVYGDL